MRYEQAKPLIEKLQVIAVLYHASQLLPVKLYEVLDGYLPDMDEGCRERGCIAVDNFKEKKMTPEDEAFEEIERAQQQKVKDNIHRAAQESALNFISEIDSIELGMMTLRKAYEIGYRAGMYTEQRKKNG